MVANSKTKKRTSPLIWLVLIIAILGFVTAVSVNAALLILLSILGLPVVIMAFYKPYWIVLFLTAFMPFESLVLKFLPVPDQIYLLAQLISEGLIYLTFALVITKKFINGQNFSRTPIDIPLILFIGIAILSIVVNQSPVVGSLLQLRTLLRYTFLFYLVINMEITAQQANTLLKMIVSIGIIQLVIGGLQLAIGGPINQFLLPRQVETEIAGQTRTFILASRGREIGSIYGTFGDTIYFGYFMLFFLAIYLARMEKIQWLDIAIIGSIFVAVNYSFSRAAVFGFLFIIIIFFRARFGINRSILSSIGFVPILILGILLALSTSSSSNFINPVQQEQSIFDNISGIFTRRYIEIAQKQRLGHLLGTAPTILANRPILGYGPDEQTAVEQINTSEPSYLLTPLTGRTANTFEDVFWVALLGYYGILGILILGYLLYQLYHVSWLIYKKANNKTTKQVGLAVTYSVALAPILLFFNQTLEFRIYGYYFWLLPAVMFTLTKNQTVHNQSTLNEGNISP